MIEVPTKDEFERLKAKVEAQELPQEVKDALLVILVWMVQTLENWYSCLDGSNFRKTGSE